MLREGKMKKAHTRFTGAVAQFVRWAVAGVLSLIVAVPAVVSIVDSV
jgi:hypothetical protein